MNKNDLFFFIAPIAVLILLIVFIILDTYTKPAKNITIAPKLDYEIVEIEGCEYVIARETKMPHTGYGFMAHKGNCKNPIHVYQNNN